jgi:membrane-bound lytic murein transglycosylase B
MTPLNRARRRALRAALSALAGGGLTAATLGAPFVGAAVGDTSTNAGESTAPAAESTSTTPETETGTTPTTTTTAPTTTSETPTTSTATTPTTSAPTATTPSPETSSPGAQQAPVAEVPAVVLQRKQKASTSVPASTTQTTSTEATSTSGKSTKKSKRTGGKSSDKASGPNGVAASPQSVAAEAGQLVALLASAEASDQALGFYRIPLFLLPIYKAAAVQYGVPWQILAAINEIETDYGTDLSVSTAGAVGWMQFMPSTWLQYGVDALNAGYADPYNPVDAICVPRAPPPTCARRSSPTTTPKNMSNRCSSGRS